MRRWAPWISLVTLGMGTGCAPFSALTEATDCGNHVLEAGEACDHAEGALDPGDGEPLPRCYAPGEKNECQLACDPGATAESDAAERCAEGYSCGNDGVCRQPIGALGPEELLAADPTLRLFTGNFDGDRSNESELTDLVSVGQTEVNVHYLDATGARVANFIFQTDATTPAITRLTNDGDPAAPDPYDDLALLLADDRGIAVFRGQDAQSLEATVYPTGSVPPDTGDVKIVVADCVPAPGNEVLGFLTVDGPAGASTNIIGFAEADIDGPVSLVGNAAGGGLPGKLVGNVASVRFDNSLCDTIVFLLEVEGNPLESGLYAYQPCRYDAGSQTIGWNAAAAPGFVPYEKRLLADEALQTQMLPWAGVFVADLQISYSDVDTPELLVGMRSPDGKVHEICAVVDSDLGSPVIKCQYGVPATPDVAKPDFPIEGYCAGEEATPVLHGPPLAVADLNADGKDEIIDANGFFFFQLFAGLDWARHCNGDTWSAFMAGDFNLTGLRDIVFTRSGAEGVHFLSGAYLDAFGIPYYNYYTIPTAHPVDQLTRGDFDGDLITDLAVREVGEESGHLLRVLFGAVAGAPEPPITIARFDSIETIVSGPVLAGDGISDLIVLSKKQGTEMAPSPSEFSIILGNTSRLLMSPYSIVTQPTGNPPSMPEEYDAVAIAGADFDGDGTGDLAALVTADGQSGKAFVALARGGGEADFRPVIGQEIAGYDGVSSADLFITGVDLDGASAPSPGSELVAFYRDAAKEDALVVVRFDEAGESTLGQPMSLTAAIEERLGSPGARLRLGKNLFGKDNLSAPVRVADIDGNGGQDIVLLTDTGAVVILWNDRTGSLDPGAMSVVVPGTGGSAGPAGGLFGIQDVAFLNLDATPRKELVVLTSEGLFRADLLDTPDREVSVGAYLEGSDPDRRSILGMDVDKDGLDDLIIGGQGGIQIQRGTLTLE